MTSLLTIFITKAYAAADMFGNISTPIYNKSYGNIDTPGKGLTLLLGNALRIFFVVAGILAVFNFTLAGFQYMLSGGDPKQTQDAWSRIYLSLVGLILIGGSFALAAVFGYLIFGDALFMLRPQIYGPSTVTP
jgi:hypothetical protein